DRLRRRADGACHRAGTAVGGLGRIGCLARQLGGPGVDAQRLVLQPVLGEDQRGAAEGVRLRHVRPGLEVGAVDVPDEVGAAEDEGLVAALQPGASEVRGLQRPGLDERTHRAVEDEDALGERLAETLDALVGRGAHRFSPERRNTRNGELAFWGWTSRLTRSKPALRSWRSRSA